MEKGNTILHQTLREKVADAIREKILRYELKPGARITEQELAREFGVSHGPVREALRQLEQEGLLEYTRNIGCSVREVSLRDIIEALLLRGSYELIAVRACNGNISDEGLKKMSIIVEHMIDMDRSNYNESILYDSMFHKVLIQEAKMPYLTAAWEALEFVSFFTFYTDTRDIASLVEKQYANHKRIYDVYCTRDYHAICDIIHYHYMVSIERKLQDNNLKKSDFDFSFDILNVDH